MSAARFHTSPPPRPSGQNPAWRRHVHGPIVPMDEPRGWIAKLIGRCG